MLSVAVVGSGLVGATLVGGDAPATLECLEVTAAEGTQVLVFSRTAAYRHDSIAAGARAIQDLGIRHGFAVEHTEDPAHFSDEDLSDFAVVVFLNTSGDVLNADQKDAFVRFIQGGGGYVGIHAAADTEHDWAWYGQLVGAYFRSHPPIQPATVRIQDTNHPSTRCVSPIWERVDEWYDYYAPPAPEVTILATLDPGSYQGGQMGEVHPIAWYHHFDGGRAWYTGLGHTIDSYAEAAFLDHLAGGILWAAATPE